MVDDADAAGFQTGDGLEQGGTESDCNGPFLCGVGSAAVHCFEAGMDKNAELDRGACGVLCLQRQGGTGHQ